MKGLLVLILLVACSGDRGIEYQPDRTLEGQEEIVNFSFSEVKIQWGEDVSGSQPDIRWTTTPCPHSSKYPTSVVWNDECYSGLMFGCDEIYVADRGPIGNSALIHELGHCYRLYLKIDGDAQHADKAWWAMMTNIREKVQENEY